MIPGLNEKVSYQDSGRAQTEKEKTSNRCQHQDDRDVRIS